MPRKIATLYAEIGADTNKLKQGLKDTKTGLDHTKQAMKEIKSYVANTTAALAILGTTFKVAFDVGKQGAQLDYMRSKFDKLSLSIGITGDVLLGKLRKATNGMRSDAELVASATDFMALGFAKTSEEAVRLTKVAGALNMDMNQLVLTLANQTTMRFDQLGVSVDGFKERVEALKRSGMDANDAFKEAFLQQAEEQIRKVGDAADSTVSDFDRLEAATKNIADALKQKLSKPLAEAATAMYDLLTMSERLNQITQEHNENVAKSNMTYAEYRAEMKRAAEASGLVIQETKNGIKTYENHLFVMKDVTEQMRVMTEAEWEEFRAAEAAAALRSSFTNNDRLAAWAERSAQGMEGLTASVGKSLEAWARYRDAIEGIKETQLDINLATIDLKNAQKEYGKSVGEDVAKELENAGLTGDKYREALELIDQTMGTQLGVQQDYNDRVAELAQKYVDGKIKGDEFKQSLINIKDEFGPFDEKIKAINDRLFYLNLQLDKLKDRVVNVTVKYTEEGPIQGISSNPNSSPTAIPAKPTQSKPGGVQKEAVGGAVFPGNIYSMNEPRNELFVPSGNGYILSKRDAQRAAGGANIVVHIHGDVNSMDTARKYAQYTAAYIQRRS